jgi:hypothetical protein
MSNLNIPVAETQPGHADWNKILAKDGRILPSSHFVIFRCQNNSAISLPATKAKKQRGMKICLLRGIPTTTTSSHGGMKGLRRAGGSISLTDLEKMQLQKSSM